MDVTVSNLDRYIWAAGITQQSLLCTILAVRRVWKRFPVFTCYIAYDLLQSVLLMCFFTPTINTNYVHVYWFSTAIDHVMELAVVLELTRAFFLIDGRWVSGVRAYLVMITAGMVFLSASLSMGISPPHTHGEDLFAMRATLFACLLFCGLFAGISWIASTVVKTMPTSTWAIWIGFVINCGAAMLQTINSATFGWHHGDRLIDHCVNSVFLTVLLFWILYFSTLAKRLRHPFIVVAPQ